MRACACKSHRTMRIMPSACEWHRIIAHARDEEPGALNHASVVPQSHLRHADVSDTLTPIMRHCIEMLTPIGHEMLTS